MSDGGRDDDRVFLRVDRLAAAMDAARARAACEAGGEAEETSEAVPQATLQVAPPVSEPVAMACEGEASGSTGDVPQPARPAREGFPRTPGDPTAVAEESDRAGGADRSDGPLVLNMESIVGASDTTGNPPDRPGQADYVEALAEETAEAATSPAEPVLPAVSAEPTPQIVPNLLSLRGVHTEIGRDRVLDGVDLDVPLGQVTALLGCRGAGKTTTLRSIMGLSRPRAGQILFAGEQIAGWRADRIARRGVGYVPQGAGIFEHLTVAENIRLAARRPRLPQDRLEWILRTFPVLHEFWKVPAGCLSGGQRQMLAFARAVIVKQRLYLFDEPTSGLAPAVVETILGALRDLKLQGATVLLAEQNFAVAEDVATRCTVMDAGRVAWAGETVCLSADTDLRARLLGPALETA